MKEREGKGRCTAGNERKWGKTSAGEFLNLKTAFPCRGNAGGHEDGWKGQHGAAREGGEGCVATRLEVEEKKEKTATGEFLDYRTVFPRLEII